MRYRDTRHDVGSARCKAADTGVAICPEQIEVVSVDVTSHVFNFRRSGPLVASYHAIREGKDRTVEAAPPVIEYTDACIA